ncbi:midasin isoform X1 [Chiloscyllium plagiosum]|uniref:midasin isoform X1 n=1 Tax=Chiloscyllium plagiosum TaxID=36176 RepID=UPI001CB7B44A|nr:midasin isoform X1 [Chiloscyllium plagiosum]
MEDMEFQFSSLTLIARLKDKSGCELNKYLTKQIWNKQDRQCILNTLAQLLLDKDCTLLIGRHLRPLLLDLLERNVQAIKGAIFNHDLHERLCVAMSKLIDISPDVISFALRYFKDSPPVFQRLFLESSDSSAVRYGRKRMKLRDLMSAAYRLLKENWIMFSKLWDWSVCIPLLRSHDTLVRWYTARCLAVVTNMNDEQKNNFFKKILTAEELTTFRLQLLEEALSLNVEKALILANSKTALWQKTKPLKCTQGHIMSGDLSENVVPVCAVVLPRKHLIHQDQLINQSLVLVASTSNYLQSLAMAVTSQKAVLLEGPIGCGKTTLVEHLAALTGRQKPPDFLKVQLGDQTDSKMLLGMYRCADVPGEFVWQPGSLTQAVTNGYWLLLEDIDHAPLDVISVLIPLLETGELLIPGQSDCIKAAPGFQFFATRRLFSSSVGWYRQQSSHATLLDKLWTKIQLDSMNKAELKEVLLNRYPSLEIVIDRLLDIYCQLTGTKHQGSQVNLDGNHENKQPPVQSETKIDDKEVCLEGRGLSLRDLLKWCERIIDNFDCTSSSTALHIFREALDCFTAMMSKRGSRKKMAEVIGSKLNISKEKVEFYCRLYKPAVEFTEVEVTVGRAVLPRQRSDVVLLQLETQTFSATRPSSLLLEQLAVCLKKKEPVLLVGETGTGKTSTVQYLARITGHKLKVVNMNQQSDTADLLGGYKPMDRKLLMLPLREAFEELFIQTYSRKQNITFLGHVQTCCKQKRWQDLLRLMLHVYKTAINKELKPKEDKGWLKDKWELLGLRLTQAQQQMKRAESSLIFAFVEGTLAQAVKKGEWILLDEINLASAETLECLSGLLEGNTSSLVLLDRGDTEPIHRDPEFRLFACMNPATDVGKKNLPPGIRNRFTELYVEELEDEGDLRILISDYLKGLNVSKKTVQGIIEFYLSLRKEKNVKLMDGTGHRPHYSLRTLCRALRFAALNTCNNVQRSLYEGFCMSFLTQLDRVSHPIVEKLICCHIIGNNAKAVLQQPIPEPKGGQSVQIEGYWIATGDKEPSVDKLYILTPSVKLNLRDLARVVAARIHPVLIQGETSVGKTSLICWLAAATGNHCVRINNHEHTDIQEYIGCYASDETGKLVFKEGVLINAMRKGHWIILDELNLAPTDVLEALNRLLDDNRELFITETQEVVKAHPRFMLFATQNPPGLYGGRKMLSRAFRNRFVELHFDELPKAELEIILNKRSSLPPSYCAKLVKVMLELQSYRRGSSVFAGKHGFITLRELFRWAERYRLTEQLMPGYDWIRHIATDAYMLLAGRVRKEEEVFVIHRILEKEFKRKLVPEVMFSKESLQKRIDQWPSLTSNMSDDFRHVVWTYGMRKLAILVGQALKFREAVLIVGETGCGKTTVCQMFASLFNQKLHAVNCHLHLETSDFLGGLRPVRHSSSEEDDANPNRLFEWQDGPLVLAMKEDNMFLMDEISLADDSVLERLNSVLEDEQSLLLAEKGTGEDDTVELITAGNRFRILATMNPGGDFGKKELSPALRNRFTEIWCPPINSREDMMAIIQHNLSSGLSFDEQDHEGKDIAELILDFIDWLKNQEFGRRCVLSIRDLLSWVEFMNVTTRDVTANVVDLDEIGNFRLDPVTGFIHAACLTCIDGIGAGSAFSSPETTLAARKACLTFLLKKLSKITKLNKRMWNMSNSYDQKRKRKVVWTASYFGIHPFYIPIVGAVGEKTAVTDYALNAGTTAMNAQRLLRAMKLKKPILLEGSPGVGKTSLVAALAKASGNQLVRINLSEQTDVTDLFGTDLPVEGGKGGEFAWRDGPLLAALKAGHWIVLDELNLASQSVLEGLNSCFDHRADILIPELGRRFVVEHNRTKIFGCQNPYHQGGGRKGLPKSFLNRFTQVYVDQLSVKDMEYIADTMFPAIGKNIVSKMVQFNYKINQEVMVERKWGQKGGPWEFNLRDLFRWCQLMLVDQMPGCYDPGQHVALVYADRMRSNADRNHMFSVFKEIFSSKDVGIHSHPYTGSRKFHITPQQVQVGYSILSRNGFVIPVTNKQLSILHHSLQPLESIMKCAQMGWMVILVGPAACGKTSLIQLLALLTGQNLRVMAMNSAMDTTELLGGFEQVDILRPWQSLVEKVKDVVNAVARDVLLSVDSVPDDGVLLKLWNSFLLSHSRCLNEDRDSAISSAAVNKLESLLILLQRFNNKFSTLSPSEFSDLISEFQHFKHQHSEFLDGQSRGTFEWVDGMLVQALNSGDWLLLDNVNFCSPSVLDRLNALLEPGGVLTISERGVIDGTTPTIVPHPNFRLFMTMDPAHGEISRAMRNRGIEIYVAGELSADPLDKQDIKTLLHGLGFVGEEMCTELMKLYSGVKEIAAGTSYSISSLLHCAVLIVQQLKHGLSLADAFHQACTEVFALSQSAQAQQEQVRELVEKHQLKLTSSESWGDSLVCLGLWPDSVPSAVFAAEESMLSMVHRDGQVLSYCLNRLSLSNNRSRPLTLADLELVLQSCNMDNLVFHGNKTAVQVTDELSMVPAAIGLVTEKASNQDWLLRARWLCHAAKFYKQLPELVCAQLEAGAKALNAVYSSVLPTGMKEVVQQLHLDANENASVPLDSRWNQQHLDILLNSMAYSGLHCSKELQAQLHSIANRMALLMDREERGYMEKAALTSDAARKSGRQSALRVSIAFQKGMMSFDDLPHPVLAHLAAFFEAWDACIVQCIKSSFSNLEDDAFHGVLCSILWRDRFWIISDRVVTDTEGIALLSLHWHWVMKHLLKDHLCQLTDFSQIPQEIHTISENLQSHLTSPNEMATSVKGLQKCLGRPLPFKVGSVVECVSKLKVMSSVLDVLKLRPKMMDVTWKEQLYRIKTAATDWKIKRGLMVSWGLVIQANHVVGYDAGVLQSVVDSQASVMTSQGLLNSPDTQSLEAGPPELNETCLNQLASRIQLWPVLEYLALLCKYKVVADLMDLSLVSSARSKPDQSMASAELRQLIIFCLRSTPVAAQDLREFWYLAQVDELSPEQLKLLSSGLMMTMFGAFWSSSITTNPDYWLTWKPPAIVGDDTIPENVIDKSLKGPGVLCRAIQSKCFFEILANNNQSPSESFSGIGMPMATHVTLGEWLERTRQLQDISSVLWTNMAVGSFAEFRFTDSRLQCTLLLKQLHAIKDFLPKELQEEYLQTCDQLAIDKTSIASHSIQSLLSSLAEQELLPEDVVSLLVTCVRKFVGKEKDFRSLSEKAQRGCLWVHLGLLQIQIWTPHTTFDPAVKKLYKLNYLKEELQQLQCEWKSRNLSEQLLTGRELLQDGENRHCHPRIRFLQQRINLLKEQIAVLSRKQAHRPSVPQYDYLFQDIHHYVNSIAQESKVKSLVSRLLQLLQAKRPKSRQSIQVILNEEAAWQQSHHHFRRRIAEEYCQYPDIIEPLLAAILQMQHGMRLLASEVHLSLNNKLVKQADLTRLVTCLLAFPSISFSFPTYLAQADELCSKASMETLKGLNQFLCKNSSDEKSLAKEQRSLPTQEQLLMNALLYLRCHILSLGELDQASLQLFRHICQALVNAWDEQEERRRVKEEQEASLYKYKSKEYGSSLSEEEDEKEFRQNFPQYAKDFSDLTSEPSLEEDMDTEVPSTEAKAADTAPIQESSIQTVINIHQQIYLRFAQAVWYRQSVPAHQCSDYLSAFVSSYHTAALLITRFCSLIDTSLNAELQGSQLLISSLIQNTVEGEETSELILPQEDTYDFYQYPNIQEAKKCQPILRSFTQKVKELLLDWPDHPALLQLLVVMDRIRSFPVSSALAKFLNGMEILLSKSQDWEAIASKSVSLRQHLDAVSQLIIQWRKLELNCWSSSLNFVMKRHMEKSNKHWFSIYQLIEKYLQERLEENLQGVEQQMKLPAVITTLQSFIEGATLGEFHFRLSMLLAFHCHVIAVPEQEGKDDLCSLLWNLYNYYNQFSESVRVKITELRHPIEKELKDFVKISRWNDVSFWSVKQSVEKTHRALFKFMKKFEAVLNNPCCPALTEMKSSGSLGNDDQQKQTKLEKLNCVLRKFSREKCHVTQLQVFSPDIGKDDASGEGSSLQSRLPALGKRMRKMCLKLMMTNSLPSFVENLDQFTGNVVTTVRDLQTLTVDQTADKDKQRSEVKHILMQKQRALADLFKHLTEIGLSYRKGLAWSRTNDPQDIFCLHPLDVKTAVNLIGSSDELDNMLLAEISAAWEGCQKFFYQSLARRAALQVAMRTPAKELSLGNIERCQGFTAHLMKLLVKQRQCLTGLTEQWVSLRHLIKSLHEIQKRLADFKDHDVALPPQTDIKLWMDQLRTLSMKFMVALEQLLWFLQCCPREKPLETFDELQDKPTSTTQVVSNKADSGNAEMAAASSLPEDFVQPHLRFPTPLVEDCLPSACKMRQGDPAWQQVTQQVANMLKEVKAVKAQMDEMSQQTSKTSLYSWTCFETCSMGISCLNRAMVQLQDIQTMFAAAASGNASYCPAVFKSLEYIKEEVSCAIAEFASWEKNLLNLTSVDSSVNSLANFTLEVEPAINTVLCAVQAVVKRQKEENDKEQGNEGNQDEVELHKIQSGYLSKHLGQRLSSDTTSLNLVKVISIISDLLEKLMDYRQECTLKQYQLFNQSCYCIVQLLPMLTTYSELVLYYLTVSMATHRSSGKLLSVLSQLFTDLALQGFCLPQELMEDAMGEGSTQFHDNECGGIGEGEGVKDVSDKIESEDQVEDTFSKDQKKKEDTENMADVKEEENAIEMSEDFDGKLHDGDTKKPGEDDNSEESDSDDEELDKQMGDLENAEADKLDERLWGDDDDDEDSVHDEADDTGPGMDVEKSELVAKDDNMDGANESENDKKRQEEKEEERGEEEEVREKIHEQLDEREYDENEVDPYQGNQDKQLEAEALDLPEDLNLESQDGEKSDDDQEEGGDNPFDIEEKLKDFQEKSPDADETMEETAKAEEECAEQEQDPQTEKENEGETKEQSEGKEETIEEDQNNEEEEDAEDIDQQKLKEDEQREPVEKEAEAPFNEGQQPKADEDTQDDQDVPQTEQQMEHETEGKTGEENLQCDTAVELAGSASEKDKANEEQGSGAADANQSEGHESKLMARVASQKQSQDKTQSYKRKPGRTDHERAMGDHNECVSKRLKMVETDNAANRDMAHTEQKVMDADVYEHVKEDSESFDAQTFDVATAEQQNLSGSQQEKEIKEETESIEMETDQEEELQSLDVQELKPEKKFSSTNVPGPDSNLEGEFQLPKPEEVDAATDDSESESEEIPERSSESTIHTKHELLTEDFEQFVFQRVVPDPAQLRKQLEEQLDAWRNEKAGSLEEEKAAAEMWQQYQALTAPLSQQLCEQLRLVLEPTQAAKLRGDYRTGKRLNMRKVIPYIASQFRKDKIWLRRTKPSKRQYQICLAIDDSSSMVDNHSKQLAFESLAVIGNALSLLEVGQVAVCSFGENVQLLHPFHEQFNDQSGARILRSCQFQQKKTKIAQFLESAANMFIAAQDQSQLGKPEIAQLLLIVSDGRGLFLEGKERVTTAVETARHSNIFVIFVVLDNPNSKDSILDIKVPIFKDQGESPEIRSYMEEFPFPFYIILRNVNALPETLSDALRQWFELVTAADH